MDEDKREKVRGDTSHGWVNLNRSVYPLSHIDRDAEVFRARERAKLTVLDLSEFDKRFLKSLKIAV